MRIQITGRQELERKLAAVRAAGPAAVQQTLVETGDAILDAAKNDYVPVDTGVLKDSGFLEAIELGHQFVVTVGFGGAAAAYALYVHEDLVARHIVGQAKYLEIPYRAAVAGIADVLAQRARDAIRTVSQFRATNRAETQAQRYARLREPEEMAKFIRRHRLGSMVAGGG